jgi:hypothetical protein
MAYETGTATGEQDLLDKLRIFAIAQGWTVNRYGTRADDASGKELYLTKGGKYVVVLTTATGGNSVNPVPIMCLIPVTGYSAGNYNVQPGYPGSFTATNNIPGPYVAYHFFADVDYIHVVIEVTGGSFRHFGFGTMEKFGAYTGGEYVYAQNWRYSDTSTTNNPNSSWNAIPFDNIGTNANYVSTYVRADIDGNTNKWWSSVQFGSSRIFGGFVSGTLENLRLCSPNAFNGLSILSKLWQLVQRPGGVLWSPLGAPKDIRYIDITNYTPGQEFSIGPDTWKVFPVIVKNGAANTPNSNAYGLAFRKF